MPSTNAERKEPKYRLVRAALEERIRMGQLFPGDKLPSEEELSAAFSVSAITVRKALSEMAAAGAIQRIKGKGSFVSGADAGRNSRLIALVMFSDDYQDNSQMLMVKGAQRTVSDGGYSLIVEWVSPKPDMEREVLIRLLSQNVEGMLIYPFDPNPDAANYELIQERGVPFVLLDRYNMNAPTYHVGADNFSGGMMAGRELLRLGHRDIEFLAYHFALSSERERYSGLCNALRDEGIAPPPVLDRDGLDYDALAARIREGRTTALFCSNDKLAIQVYRGLIERGIRIPGDVSMIGFDDWQELQIQSIPMTTVRQNFIEIGAYAANTLINRIKGDLPKCPARILVGVELVRRSTTGERAQK